MTMTEAAPRDDEPGDRRDVDDENERRQRRWTAEGFGRRGGEAKGDLAAAMPEVVVPRLTGKQARRNGRPEDSGEAGGGVGGDTAVFRRNRGVAGEGDVATASTKEMATSADAPTRDSSRLEGVQWHQCHWLPAGTRLRWSPHETEATPVEGKQLRRCWRRRRDRTTLRRGGRGGWRRPAAREREDDGGERRGGHERAREGAKTGERTEVVPFYKMGEGAGHGRGRNGDGKHGRRPWKAAGKDASIPDDWGRHSRGKLGGIEEESMGIKTP
uniref:BKRF1 encodes EBNA-1 protein-like n=1 Tax=Oryza sativa subsp. japonica TaxID=39947 RepID=Q6EPI4_ORYSJ|nr:hypothetical protein [Oryza sativa Japonica Group]